MVIKNKRYYGHTCDTQDTVQLILGPCDWLCDSGQCAVKRAALTCYCSAEADIDRAYASQHAVSQYNFLHGNFDLNFMS